MPLFHVLAQSPFDSEVLELILFVALILLLFFALAGGFTSTPTRQHPWVCLAERTGLTFDPGKLLGVGPNISGRYRGHELFLRTLTRGGKNKIYTHIIMDLNNRSTLYLHLYDEGAKSKIADRLCANQIKSGDDSLDERFIICGKPETLAVNLLSNESLREKLLHARLINIEIFDQNLHYERVGEETDINYLIYLLDLLDEIAENVDLL
jgi:hypothetical protein